MLREVSAVDDPAVRVGLADKLAGVITRLGKLTGASLANERMIRRSPSWRRIQDAVATALEPWPDAMLAVADALDALEERL
jgi:hypothetical protein